MLLALGRCLVARAPSEDARLDEWHPDDPGTRGPAPAGRYHHRPSDSMDNPNSDSVPFGVSISAAGIAGAGPLPGGRAIPLAARAHAEARTGGGGAASGGVEIAPAGGRAARLAVLGGASGARGGQPVGVARGDRGRQLVARVVRPRRVGADRAFPRIGEAGAGLGAPLARPTRGA
jgi:hypothetical protein